MRAALVTLLFLAALAMPARAAETGITYHATPERSGLYTIPSLTAEAAATAHLDPGFAGKVEGHVYAQPLYWQPPARPDGLIIVATESNVVAALDAKTGATVWRAALGKPVDGGSLECGNIDPLGITGTPVVDPAAGALYLDAMIATPQGPQQEVFGLSLVDGKVLPDWPVVVETALAGIGKVFKPQWQNQRGALSLVGGKLFVGYGGFWGDCGDYHGWVVGFDPQHPGVTGAWETRARGGAVWGQGGIVSDGTSLYVTTGNTMGAGTWSDGEAAFRLTPSLDRSDAAQDYFTPADWKMLDDRDLDLGGTAPVPLDVAEPQGRTALLLAMGKDGKAYLMDRHDLGGIGGALVARTVSSRQIKTAPAVYPVGGKTYVAFQGPGSDCSWFGGSGLTTLAITADPKPAIATAWCAALDGAGAPIVTTTDGTAEPIVWAVGAEGDDLLHGYAGADGKPIFAGGGTKLAGLHHFQSLLAAAGRLYIGADDRVYAFAFGR